MKAGGGLLSRLILITTGKEEACSSTALEPELLSLLLSIRKYSRSCGRRNP